MTKDDAEEAATITRLVLAAILSVTPTQGRPGADLRTGIGDFDLHALELIQYDQAGRPLARIFESARKNGISLPELSTVRAVLARAEPATPGGVLMKNSLINLCLATESRIIADTEFQSRQAAEDMKDLMNEAFVDMEDLAADSMDSETYRALMSLHAAVTFHLITAERPLPYMRNFQFAAVGSTLVFAYRLYDDAGRADELRAENGVIHPLFTQPFGRALSS